MFQQIISDFGSWLTGLPTVGQFIMTVFISMIPIIEMRGAIPIAVVAGLPWPLAFTASVIGSMIPVPFIVAYIRRVFLWLKDRNKLARVIFRLEKKALSKAKSVYKYELLGLGVFVAIPLPGTGAWSGALIAALLNMRLRDSLLVIFAGVVTASGVICVISYGVKAILG